MRGGGNVLDVVVYGKIIIDDIRLDDGTIVRGVLGGGGPQAAFGARVWAAAVGFLSRAGADLEAAHRRTLEELAIDPAGVARYDDLPTLRGSLMAYDDQGYMAAQGDETERSLVHRPVWTALLSRPLTLPPAYLGPRAIHLVTEYADEPMVRQALALRAQGALCSLEPLIDYRAWTNREEIIALLRRVDLVTPDWPSASGIAGSTEPRRVLDFWARLGPRLVAIRHGHHGSYVWDGDHDRHWHIPAVPVRVVDPTGAGNSFGGGLCAGWLATEDARSAGTHGAVAASFLVERVGLPAMSAHLRAAAGDRLTTALPLARPLSGRPRWAGIGSAGREAESE